MINNTGKNYYVKYNCYLKIFIISYLNRDDSFPLNNGLLVVVVVVVVLFLPDSLDLKLFRIMGLNLEEDEPRLDVLDDFVRDGDGVVDVLSLNFCAFFSSASAKTFGQSHLP